MSLRLRLLAIIGLSFTLLWSAASVWMFIDLRQEFRDTLDERLAASASMVAGLISQLPSMPETSVSEPRGLLEVVSKDGVACEIRLLRGDLIARTGNTPEGLGMTRAGYGTRTIDGTQWRSFTLEQDGVRVTTADRVDQRASLLRDIVLAAALPFLIAMGGSMAVLWFGVRRGLAPLEAIRKALGERRPDALHPIAEAPVPTELTPLVHTINVLLERVQGAIDRERRFTGDAAHELRTPLTAVKTHIQVARLSGANDNATALAHAEEGVRRLQRTLEQLLTLARVEGPFSFENGEAATVRSIVQLAMDEIYADNRKRVIENGVDSEATVSVPPALAVIALRNLLDNALRYSPADKPVTLRVLGSSASIAFEVLDEGPGLDKEELNQATCRFWRKGAGQGSGLGLSIVNAIVAQHGGALELHARQKHGLAAVLRLPRP